MKKIYFPWVILAGILIILALPLTSAKPNKQYSAIDLGVPCSYNGTFCDSTALCNITITYPNTSLMVSNDNMTNLGNGKPFYPLPDTSITGTYEYTSGCCQLGVCDSYSSTFEITPTGVTQTSILENPIILVFVILGIVFLFFGIYLSLPAFAFLGAIMFLLSGIYTMIYGFNNVTDMYTRGIGGVLIGVGFIFIFFTVYEWMFTEEVLD